MLLGESTRADAQHQRGYRGSRAIEALKPKKVIYINTMGGLLDGDDKLITNINYPSDYEWLLEQPWPTRTGLQVREIKTILDHLPSTSTVVPTSRKSSRPNMPAQEALCLGAPSTSWLLDSIDMLSLHKLLAPVQRQRPLLRVVRSAADCIACTSQTATTGTRAPSFSPRRRAACLTRTSLRSAS